MCRVITLPPVVGQSVAICMSVCLFVSLCVYLAAYLRNYVSEFHRTWYTCYLWPWLSPSLMTVQYQYSAVPVLELPGETGGFPPTAVVLASESRHLWCLGVIPTIFFWIRPLVLVFLGFVGDVMFSHNRANGPKSSTKLFFIEFAKWQH